MTEPTVTFTGHVTLSEAKRLVRETEAQAAAEKAKEPRYVKFEMGGTIYRIQPDKTAHYVGSKGEWAPLGYAWPRCEGLIEVTAADAERQCEERRPAWAYWQENADVLWRTKPGQQEYAYVANGKKPHTLGGRWQWCVNAPKCKVAITEAEATRLMTWVPRVGEWVARVGGTHQGKAVQVVQPPIMVDPRQKIWINAPWSITGASLPYATKDLRPATDAEIVAAKRIELRDGLIVRGVNAGTVWQWREHRKHWRCLSDDELKPAFQLWGLDTDHYTVLESYTVQGAESARMKETR